MLKSMTGYARSGIGAPIGHMTIEISTLNRRFLEVQFILPKEFVRFEPALKKIVSRFVRRGQVTIRVGLDQTNETLLSVTPNIALAKEIADAWQALACSLDLKLDDKSLIDVLASENSLMNYRLAGDEEKVCLEPLTEGVTRALKELEKMRAQEGKTLEIDMSKRIDTIAQLLEHIASKEDGATARYRSRLIDRLQELKVVDVESEEKILREVALYAERIDISEELTRCRSHISHFVDLICGSEEASGKKIDFLLQEMQREVNTIAAKSSEIDISRHVVEIKSELERIKEQVQNIE